MTDKKIKMIVFLLCCCFYLFSFGVKAASTSDAVEAIMPEKECSLTISYGYGETVFSDVQVNLYKIAEVSADFQYTLTPSFEASGLRINRIQSASEWDVVRSTLEAHVLAYGIEPEAVCATNEEGQVCFDTLTTGMYLAIVSTVTQEDMHFRFESALISLPGLGMEGYWQYQVSVNAKGESLPPVDSDEEIEHKVLKLWKGDEGRTDRPKSVEVEIFRDGISYETVVLSEENHWSYSWSAKDDGSNWTVVERNVPPGYVVTVDERENSFVLTNVRVQTPPDDPIKPPHTGDTSNILMYSFLMTISGVVLIAMGITGKRTNL